MTQKPWPAWETINELATDMGVAKLTRIQWRQRKKVPHKYRLPMIEKAARLKIALSSPDFERAD